MAEPAILHMTVAEFVLWDDGTGTRYELFAGVPVAMAPPAEAHRILAARLLARIDAALAGRRPCNAQFEAGVMRPDRADWYLIPDLAVTCSPNELGRQAIKDPILIVEILSSSTERHDRRVKLPIYQEIESVAEILLIDPLLPHAEVYRRDGERWIIELVRGAEHSLSLNSVGFRMPMAELYEGIALAEAEAENSSPLL